MKTMFAFSRRSLYVIFFAALTSTGADLCYSAELLGHGNNCLDVAAGGRPEGTRNGNIVQMWQCVGNGNQQWKLRNSHVVWSTHPDKCLDVRQGQTANGTQVQIWDCQPDNPNQRWIVEDNRVIWAAHPEKCLDVSAGGTANGTKVQIWNCQRGNDNQRWRMD